MKTFILAARTPEMPHYEVNAETPAEAIRQLVARHGRQSYRVVNVITSTPTIPMRDFFALPAVIAWQNVQKANPYGSAPHREAFESMKALARTYGAECYLGDY